MYQTGAYLLRQMNCPKCQLSRSIKKGMRNGNQRYYCKNCQRYFQQKYNYNAYHASTNDSITILLKEGCGVRSISRILKISKNTVLSRMLKISSKVLPRNISNIGSTVEIDEIWTYIQNKSQVTWVTYAIERKTNQVIDFFVGNKSKVTIKPLIDKVLQNRPHRIFTDRLNIYPSLIPKEIHRVLKFGTNSIERNNLTLRTHVRRLQRRTICFSKKRENLEAHLRIFFWG